MVYAYIDARIGKWVEVDGKLTVVVDSGVDSVVVSVVDSVVDSGSILGGILGDLAF